MPLASARASKTSGKVADARASSLHRESLMSAFLQMEIFVAAKKAGEAVLSSQSWFGSWKRERDGGGGGGGGGGG